MSGSLLGALPGGLGAFAGGPIAGFSALLQQAFWRGIPFSVIGSQVRKGQRFAVHQYPFRNGGWPEPMGRALRTYSFTGYLSGPSGPVMQLALDAAVERKGSGLLIHPTIGAVNVACLSCASAVRADRMRVIEVAFEFVEDSGSNLIATIIATVIQTLFAAKTALLSIGADLGSGSGPAAAAGPDAVAEGTAVATDFTQQAVAIGSDPTAIVGMAAGLPAPDTTTTYGRYAAGHASVALASGTTVTSLIAGLATQRATLATAADAVIAAAAVFSVTTDMVTPIAAMLEAVRAGITNPADQVRVLLTLAAFTYTDTYCPGGIATAMATVRDGMAAACRRAALVSLARASAAYQPVSYDDAINQRDLIAEALDSEILAAGDTGEDATYLALKTLRAAVIQDLTVRGGSLPKVVQLSLPQSMPSMAIAQRLYRDASRSDEITAEAGCPHPAFCPTSFKVLAF
jgi:prophage DNA circulation protein